MNKTTLKPKKTTAAWSSVMPDRAEKRKLKKKAILETAAQLIIESGFQSASMDELARRLSITKPTLYYYIPSKDDIALELLNLNYTATKNAIEDAKMRRGNGLQRLRHFFGLYAEQITTPVGAAAVQIALLPHSEKVRTHQTELFRNVDIAARSLISEGIEDGSIKERDSKWVDFIIFGTLHWMTRWYHAQPDQSATKVAGHLFDIIETGIATGDEQGSTPIRQKDQEMQ